MPYNGNSPVDAWEYWFDEPPSVEVEKQLRSRVKASSVEAVLEAIEITWRKSEITSELNRIKYVCGVLRRKALADIAPERVELERSVQRIQAYWRAVRDAGYPLNDRHVRYWLEYISEAGIKAVICDTSTWHEFKDLMAQIVERTAKYQQEQAEEKAKAEAEAEAEAAAARARAALALVPSRRRRRSRLS